MKPTSGLAAQRFEPPGGHHHNDARPHRRPPLTRREFAWRQRFTPDQQRAETQAQIAHPGALDRAPIVAHVARRLTLLVRRGEGQARLPATEREHPSERDGQGVHLGLDIGERR